MTDETAFTHAERSVTIVEIILKERQKIIFLTYTTYSKCMNIMKVSSMTCFLTMTNEREFTQAELKVIVAEILLKE